MFDSMFFIVVILTFIVYIYFVFRLIVDIQKPEPCLKTYSLTSRYFMYNLIYLICFISFIIFIQRLGVVRGYLFIFWICCVPFIMNRFKAYRKFGKGAFDELEELLILKSYKIAGMITTFICITGAPLSNQLSKIVPYKYFLYLPPLIYFVSINIAGWYYFRKNEKEIQQNLENSK